MHDNDHYGSSPPRAAASIAGGVLVTLGALTLAGPAAAQQINCAQMMMFGTIMPCPASAGTVTINPSNGSASAAPGCLVLSPTTTQGRCVVVGQSFPLITMQISITAPAIDLVSGTNKMVLNDFHLQSPGAGPVLTTTTAFLTVNVGATLNVGAAQPGGSYSGTVTVSVNYQ